MWPTNAAWYSPYVRWNRGKASGRSDGGILIWVLGWVRERGCDRIEFETGVWLGEHDVDLLGS